MKKLIPFFLIAFFATFTLTSCNNDDNNNYVDNDTVAVVYDIKNTNFTINNNGDLTVSGTFQNPIYGSDMILIYRQEGSVNGNPIWGLIPKVYRTPNGGAVEYTNDFTREDFQIYLDLYTDQTEDVSNFTNNQSFRVLIVPAILGRNAVSPVDFSDYQSTINYYNLNNAKVINLK